MQHDNNIENTLRQLDNQQQPDLGNMEDHWQQMQALLQPAAIAVKKGTSTGTIIGGAIISLLLLVGGTFLYQSFNSGNMGGSNNVADNTTASEKSAVSFVVPVTDTTAEKTKLSRPIVSDKSGKAQHTDSSKYFNNDDEAVFANMKINFTACENCPGKEAGSAAIAVNRAQLLQNLFTQLKKDAQRFLIDNSRDNLIQFAEGTTLLIPARSVGGKSGIVLTVKEFYRESDIILNQLNTLSDKDQLITGGMVELKATLNDNDVAIDPTNPIRLYMTDTSSHMNGMQLFNGEIQPGTLSEAAPPRNKIFNVEATGNNTSGVNWLPQYQYFSRKKIVTELRVLNIIDQPFKIKEKAGGQIWYFIVDYDSLRLDADALKQLLKDKYGYYKVRLRSSVRHRFISGVTDREFISGYANRIGDSIWMDEQTAARYQLTGKTRQFTVNETSVRDNEINSGVYYRLQPQHADLMKTMQNKYGVNITKLGWINCDRFYNDSREKIQYAVDLGDDANNYYTILVFDQIKSMMNGYADGNRVLFDHVPQGETVKVISIGINKTGETVYALQPATINKEELSGFRFETISVPGLKASLSKMDR